jgi:hypothetical protein
MKVPVVSTVAASSTGPFKVSQWSLRSRMAEATGHRHACAGFQESSGGVEPSVIQFGGLGKSVSPFTVAPPNPSLEWTRSGKALGPRGVVGHHPPRGPSAFPARAPQLKR